MQLVIETSQASRARARGTVLVHVIFACGENENGVPNGSRTRVAAVKGRCPRPLDDRDARAAEGPDRKRFLQWSAESIRCPAADAWNRVFRAAPQAFLLALTIFFSIGTAGKSSPPKLLRVLSPQRTPRIAEECGPNDAFPRCTSASSAAQCGTMRSLARKRLRVNPPLFAAAGQFLECGFPVTAGSVRGLEESRRARIAAR